MEHNFAVSFLISAIFLVTANAKLWQENAKPKMEVSNGELHAMT